MRRELTALAAAALGFGALIAGPAPGQAAAALSRQSEAAVPASGRANFAGEPASEEARLVADWVVASSNNAGMPFVIVDKLDAKIFVFGVDGRLLGAAPALVGLTPGDDAAAGIGDRPLSTIGPKERVTPAGRFVASLGRDLKKDVLWVDYKGGVAIHRVVTNNPKEHRLQRLAAASPLAHRISYGCINVPAAFYDKFIHPAFAQTNGVVYILPEIKPIAAVFAGYAAQPRLADQP
jgi:hypothetical protein